jgi:RHS repeat-associated protein
LLTDANGNVTDTYDYDAFGNMIARTGSTPNLYLFTGEQYDPDLGLYYLRARYQNTSTGRFWTMDSFAGLPFDPTSLHKYLYAHANPVSGSDPTGMYTLKEVMFTVGTLGIVTAFANASIFGLGLAIFAADIDVWPPDAYIASVSLSGATRGFDAALSLDILLRNGRFIAYVGWAAGLAPVSYFRSQRNAWSVGVTGGVIFGMDSLDQWSGPGITATVPSSVIGLIPKAMLNSDKMFYAIRQLSKRTLNTTAKDKVWQMSLSGGAAALKIGFRANSFTSEASYAFGPYDIGSLLNQGASWAEGVMGRLSSVNSWETIPNIAQEE